MNFGGHLMAGWLLSHWGGEDEAERRAITLMAIAPDADGIFVLGPAAWREWHRTFSHNIFWAALIPLATLLFLKKGRRLALLPFLYISIASHYLLDVFVTGWWGLAPLWPLSRWEFLMSDYIPEDVMKYYIQIGLFIALLIPTFYFIRTLRRSPLELFGRRVDRFFLRFIALPWREYCTVCGGRAFYRCDECGATLCGRHRSFIGFLKISCKDRHGEKSQRSGES